MEQHIRLIGAPAWAIETAERKLLGTTYFNDPAPLYVLGCPFAAFLTRSDAREALRGIKATNRQRKARVVKVRFAYYRMAS